ncbi:MAG: FAD:protein FMN transferase [Pseudomonadota bacterium]
MGRVVFLALGLIALAGCWPEEAPKLLSVTGETMGTTYSVTTVGGPEALDEAALTAAIDAALAQVNGAMNNWDPASEVSRFNSDETTDMVEISEDFAAVMAASDHIHDRSGGAFDVTLAPLIELWGFGPRTPDSPVPSDAEIAAAMRHVGQGELLTLGEASPTLTKSDPAVSVNLSAIAKGYGVDAVARAIAALGVPSYLVEIGGDLAARGTNPMGEVWQIGIERPEPGGRTVQQIVRVPDLGLATSGDYRNYFEEDGVRYSHIIDATTGRPITHQTASVTVLADNAMLADGWATALLALGSARAMEIAEEEGLAVFAIDRAPDGDSGGFVTVASPAFNTLLEGGN